jgi:NAD(P)-dependent dehydrogenase (short-subunit alcohol dehydrogenase family)
MSSTALVTGASSGIGAATVRRLRAEGYIVYAAARRIERLHALETDGVHAIAMDVTDDQSMQDGVARVLAETGRIDVLVNNAGYGSYGAVEEVPIDEGRRQVEVNLIGLARLVQLVTPTMRAQRSGRIINVSSVGGKGYEPLGAWYHATKWAVEGFSDSLRLELAPFGIQVAIIEPGAIRTEWGQIAVDGLLKASGDGPYADQARSRAAVLATTIDEKSAADPSIVADAIAHAATIRRPKTRYPVPRAAQLLVFMPRILTDRMLDRLTLRAGAEILRGQRDT